MSVGEHDRRINEIREREQAASNGPWWYDGRDIFHKPNDNNLDQIIIPLPLTWHESQAVPDSDASFVAHAREDIPWLLAELAAVREERDRLRDALKTKDAVLARLADRHHRTLTGSGKHDPERILDFRDCPCLTCREAADSLAEPHSQPCDCAWCRFQRELADLSVSVPDGQAD